MTSPTLMETETRETPEVAGRLIASSPRLVDLVARLRANPPRFALAAGRGSSSAATVLAKYLFEQRLGLPTAYAAPSVHSVYGGKLAIRDALVLAISQSGRSPDLVDYIHAARGEGVTRVGMVNDVASPLAQTVDVCLPLDAGPERSVAATKSCLAAMLLVYGLGAHWREDPAMIAAFESSPGALAKALTHDWSELDTFLDGDGPVYVVGRGPGYAIAKEAALKLKETCGLHAEAISGAEIRHGPMALAGPELRTLVFIQNDAAKPGLTALVNDLRQRGSPVMAIEAGASPGVDRNSEPVLELLAMLQRFYLAANSAALRHGRSPDHPPALSKVTETR